jgi:type IV secretion system protein VirB9
MNCGRLAAARHWKSAAYGCALLLPWVSGGVHGETLPARGSRDARIRVAAFDRNEVYRLYGFVGYQIDIEFEAGESFVGLGAGDLDALSFVGQGNHLFLKPKAARVATNLTVLTTRRRYEFDYTALPQRPDSASIEVIYSLRFTYPEDPARVAGKDSAERVDRSLDASSTATAVNENYWYCGHPGLKPVAASDDGVHTRLRFAAEAELPAIFLRNGDGTESLLNFSVDAGDVIIHRVAARFIVRRGKLTGCIVNRGFHGGGLRLESGTVAPDVQRVTRGARP